MSGLPTSAGVDPSTSPPTIPFTRPLLAHRLTADEARLAGRRRLLKFILDNHRRRQLDAVRGLRGNGAG